MNKKEVSSISEHTTQQDDDLYPDDVTNTPRWMGNNMPVTMTACEVIGMSGGCDGCPMDGKTCINGEHLKRKVNKDE